MTIARIPVGGMTAAEATAAVQAAFDKDVPFRHKTRLWSVKPSKFRAVADVDRSVAVALTAQPGQLVRLSVTYSLPRVEAYVAYLDRVLSRSAVNSRLSLRNLRPFITKPKKGLEVLDRRMRIAIEQALVRTERKTIPLAATVLQPTVNRLSFGPIIVIRRGSRKLYLYRNMNFVRRFSVAVGTSSYPTPIGNFRVVSRERHPTWDPPNSPWAAGLGPVPPGPNNPLGTRWIGTSAPGIGIHGTPQPWTVGTAASHGCIRMYMREVEWLFERVKVGARSSSFARSGLLTTGLDSKRLGAPHPHPAPGGGGSRRRLAPRAPRDRGPQRREGAEPRRGRAQGGEPCRLRRSSSRRSTETSGSRSQSFRGKAVVVNFWASWCEPCKEETPLLQEAYERYRADGLVVLGVNAQDFRADARRFAGRYDVTYPLVHDGPGATRERWGLTGFPETYWIDRQGRLVAYVRGQFSAGELERNIERALGPA